MKQAFNLSAAFALALAVQASAQETKTVVAGAQAPEFKIKAADGTVVELAKLAEKGPVLVRLTCGCLGCDKELDYFKASPSEETRKVAGSFNAHTIVFRAAKPA